jgi:hypothetical protein
LQKFFEGKISLFEAYWARSNVLPEHECCGINFYLPIMKNEPQHGSGSKKFTYGGILVNPMERVREISEF